jgi:hypothetical protein
MVEIVGIFHGKKELGVHKSDELAASSLSNKLMEAPPVCEIYFVKFKIVLDFGTETSGVSGIICDVRADDGIAFR